LTHNHPGLILASSQSEFLSINIQFINFYRQELQFFDAQELQPPEPAELTVPPFPSVLLKLQADISFSMAQSPHWGHCSGSFEPNTRSSKLCWHPQQ
jgi:hypothetical protein